MVSVNGWMGFQMRRMNMSCRYEIVDAYRQYSETYLPLRMENFPRELWENFRNFFKSEEATEEIEDEEP